ncbi:TonB-dependent receptor [Portibacter lacus]|uniref:TonB-dependent receptor n=1 Tax=Portibacter lacus TaxID=1099794 RepID=A0AA37WIA0_9BACT|nr:TonB-dependent receptor [Portibacter lacus]GLR19470.1 TonB-dependent receptor [Portibacter lacus]
MIRLITLLLLLTQVATAQFSISGEIRNDENEALIGASVFLEGTSYGVITDDNGYYEIEDVPEGEYILKATYLGYRPETESVNVIEDLEVSFVLGGSIFGIEEIEINGTWVKKNMPFSYKNSERESIERLNLGQDVPYVLKYTPSMVVTSDAGAGIGYTGMRIRGSDPSRINVTINGVPLNDSESQLVFWVDLPDFASSAEEIQIQRGVGPSTNGTSAFGASINLKTNKVRLKPYMTVATGLGSFNTNKIGVSAGTGLLNNKFGFDIRYSAINSDGYIDRASSKLNSFAGTFNYVTESSSLNFNLMTGSEITYQAWNGLPYQLLETDRTYNSAGTDKPGDPYKDEVDDYNQSHMQLHYNKAVNENLNINLKGHYTRGLGFFENYKGDEQLSDFGLSDPQMLDRDIVIQRWLDNHFYGVIAEFNYKDLEERHNLIYGVSANQYLGNHFGQVRWHSGLDFPVETLDTAILIAPADYYRNLGNKIDFNTYGKWSYKFKDRFLTYLDLQYRYVNYAFEGYDDNGVLVDQVDNLSFFNPKAGISYLLNNDSKIYISYAVANREPNRNDYTESSTNSRPQHETLYDLELGYTLQTDVFSAGVNIYNMSYDNQLVLTGAINDVGEYSRQNVESSYRRGVEFDGGLKDFRGVHFLVNATLSENRIKSFTEYIDDWDNGGQIEKTYELTDLAFSPSIILANDMGVRLLRNNQDHALSISLLSKYVGKQYIDNTSNENAALDAYFYNDLLFSYSFMGINFVKEIQLNFNVYNLFDQQYVSNAWVYRFSSEGYNPVADDPSARAEGEGTYNLTGLYPQAGRYFLVGLNFKF